MKQIIIHERKDEQGWHAWVEQAKGKQVFRLTDICAGASRAEAAGKLLLGYPEITGLTVGTIYLDR
jgi:hypothetical protein